LLKKPLVSDSEPSFVNFYLRWVGGRRCDIYSFASFAPSLLQNDEVVK
jgi:hypothetical protein